MIPSEQDRQRAAAMVARFPAEGPLWENGEFVALQKSFDAAIKEGDQGLLFALHEACTEHLLLRGWPRQSAWRAAGQITEASALRIFLEHAKNPPSSELPWGTKPRLPDGPARNLGAMLAYAQSDELLERELEHFGPEPKLRDLFACWIHERVVRGSPVSRSAFVQQFCRALPAEHPLARLPLDLRPLEEGVIVVSARRFDLLGNWLQFGATPAPGVFEPEGDWQTTFEEGEDDVADLAAIASDPRLCPNSSFEGRVFQLSARPTSLRSLSLSALGLQCLGAMPATVKTCDARHVMSLLLILGTQGGAYGEARSAAYGRLLAWRSLTALVGLPPDSSFAEVEALAARTQWLSFESENEWFNHVSLDVGLVALRPDDSLAVLAITDTD